MAKKYNVIDFDVTVEDFVIIIAVSFYRKNRPLDFSGPEYYILKRTRKIVEKRPIQEGLGLGARWLHDKENQAPDSQKSLVTKSQAEEITRRRLDKNGETAHFRDITAVEIPGRGWRVDCTPKEPVNDGGAAFLLDTTGKIVAFIFN